LRVERVEGAELLATERDETDKDLSHERSALTMPSRHATSSSAS